MNGIIVDNFAGGGGASTTGSTLALTVCMKDEIATLRTHLADAVAFVRKAGHLPGCGRRKHCAVCNAPPFAFTHSTNRADSHPYKEGPCTCGHDRIVGSEGE